MVFSFVCLLFATALFAGNSVKVKSGDAAVLKEKSNAFVVFDYAATKVGDKTMQEYLKSWGEDFVRDWPNDQVKVAAYFKERFNKKNKKGMQIISDKADAAYTIIVHVKKLDMGNGGSSFVPFAGAKAGGVIMTGTVDVVNNKTPKVVCTFSADEVKGLGHVSETVRLGMAYFQLATELCGLAK